MNTEKIEKIFDIMADFCEGHNCCSWCPFSDDKSECKFRIATENIPLTFETLMEEE